MMLAVIAYELVQSFRSQFDHHGDRLYCFHHAHLGHLEGGGKVDQNDTNVISTRGEHGLLI